MALPRRTVCVLLLACTGILAAGCGGDEPIGSYKVPRQAEPKRTTYRILGALYPEAAPVWYFKFAGSLDDLTKHEAEWENLITSVKYKSDKDVPEFTVPAGWTKTGPREKSGILTNEVIKVGNGPLEVTVTLISNNGPGSDLKANLARWAFQQLDAEYDEDKILSMAEPFAAAGGRGLRVDFRGPKNPTAPGGPMMKR